MNRSNVARSCDGFDRFVTPYVDGELDPGHSVEVEMHLTSCASCTDKIAAAHALRLSLKRTYPRPLASCALRERMEATVAGECAASSVHGSPASDRDRPKLVGLRYAVLVAAAAGVAFAAGVSRMGAKPAGESVALRASASAETPPVMFDALLDDLVALHARPLPPETTNLAEVARFEPIVGIPMRKPSLLPMGSSFQGARVNASADRRALLLQYVVAGSHRVTVYVFNPREVPLRPARLHATQAVERPLYVGTLRGYSVAATEDRRGVGYALASDLGDDETTKLMAAAAAE